MRNDAAMKGPMLPDLTRAAVAALALVLVLSACSGGAKPTTGISDAEQAGVPQSATKQQDMPSADEPEISPADRKTRLAALPPVNDDPQQFMGLEGHVVDRKLGPPTLIRRDGKAEVWVYRGTGCRLDIFFYAEQQSLTARFVDLRKVEEDGGREPRACLRRMLEDRLLLMADG